PALTKRDLIRYFAQVSPYILPHLADRPLTMIRMPEGIHGQRFFQKHWEQERPPFVETITVFSGHKDESHDYLLCNNLPTLLWLAQSGTLEFHVWHSRARPGPDAASQGTDYASSPDSLEASVLNYPDYVVFDIDPYIYSGKEKPGDEPELNTVAFEKGKEVAFALRELLASMGLEAVAKTSGKTGLHIFVPIRSEEHTSELQSLTNPLSPPPRSLLLPYTTLFRSLCGVRHRPVHLLREGKAGRRARAEHCRLREGEGSRVRAARAARQHGPGGGREDLGQDRAAYLRAD